MSDKGHVTHRAKQTPQSCAATGSFCSSCCFALGKDEPDASGWEKQKFEPLREKCGEWIEVHFQSSALLDGTT